jgi:hypothetical protein
MIYTRFDNVEKYILDLPLIKELSRKRDVIYKKLYDIIPKSIEKDFKALMSQLDEANTDYAAAWQELLYEIGFRDGMEMSRILKADTLVMDKHSLRLTGEDNNNE